MRLLNPFFKSLTRLPWKSCEAWGAQGRKYQASMGSQWAKRYFSA